MDTDRKLRHDLERVLRERDTTQAELARRLGMSPQYLNDVLTGRRARIPGSLARILEALDLELTVTRRAAAEAPKLPAELAALLEAAGPLELRRGEGELRGSRVRSTRPGSVSDAVSAERDERTL